MWPQTPIFIGRTFWLLCAFPRGICIAAFPQRHAACQQLCVPAALGAAETSLCFGARRDAFAAKQTTAARLLRLSAAL